jgi:hypothetical protein
MKFRVFWDITPCSQIDVDIYLTTQQYIPEDSELQETEVFPCFIITCLYEILCLVM